MAAKDSNIYGAWIEALTIFSKYETDALYPIQFSDDVVYSGSDPVKVDEEDRVRLAHSR